MLAVPLLPPVDAEVFAFLTTTPNKLVTTIHPDTMPVILSKEHEFEAWLKVKPDEAFSLVKKYPADIMRIVQQGTEEVDRMHQ